MTSPSRLAMVASDQEVLDAFPDVRLDHDNKYYYAGLLRRQLLMNRCSDCGEWHTPPRAMCPRCWSNAVVPTAVSGIGTVRQFTVVPGSGDDPGTILGAVELDEQAGLCIAAPIGGSAGSVRIGSPVMLEWVVDGRIGAYEFRVSEARSADETAPGGDRR